MDMGKYDLAHNDLIKALDLDRYDVIAPVTMAELQSLRGNEDAACQAVKRAVRNGFRDLSVIEKNSNFDHMVMDQCYQKIVDALQPDDRTALNPAE
jgi:hypothetical protein